MKELSNDLSPNDQHSELTRIFIEKATKVHQNRYSYDTTVYVHSHKKVEITCQVHGTFSQVASYHIQGFGCRMCQYDAKRMSYTKYRTIDEIRAVINEKFPIFLILDIQGINFKSKVHLECPHHGKFQRTVSSIHSSRFLCKRCSHEHLSKDTTMNQDEFIRRCIEKHGDTYDYSKTVYRHSHKKAIFICRKHGEFEQYVSAHLTGSGCPRCRYRVSKNSTKWLDSLNNRNIEREQYVEGKFVDGFDPSTNTIYEFYGDYWHGNSKVFDSQIYNKRTKCTMGELYQRTNDRRSYLESKGYTVIEVWESDFIRAT